MNDPSQHELDDELLSAYLDDELSAEERALVEARLAADPASQQTLDQLRHVSQSVRSLPREPSPSGIQDAVLRRIEAIKTKDAAPAPTISIGRTRRGWIWASLAVAAALLIMFVQSDDTDNHGGPAVAMKDGAETSERSAEAPTQWSARSQIAENEPRRASEVQDLAAAPAAAEPMTRDFSDSLAESAPAPATSAPADTFGTEAVPTDDTLANSTMRESVARRSVSGSAAAAPEAEMPAEEPAEDQLVVVHVLAKSAAIKNKAFDALLASNGVVVAPTDDAAKPTSRFGQLSQKRAVASGRTVGQEQVIEEQSQSREEESKQQPEEVDVVLVEAPTTTILSCMQDLNHDSDNYLGVRVDAPPATEDNLAKIKAPQVKKFATDLGIYNRGAVPLDAKDKFEGDRAYFGYGKALDESTVADSNFGRGGGVGGATQEGRKALAWGNNSERGRALRLPAQAVPSGGELAFSGGKLPAGGAAPAAISGTSVDAEQPQPRGMIRELKERSWPAEQPMQVLFVLRAGDEPAPSAPPTDRAE